MLFSAHCTAGDSVSVWPCPRCFSSRAPQRRYVGQAGRHRFHRRRRERDVEKRRERRRAKARTRTLLPKLEGRVGLPICLPTFLPTFPCPYCPWRSSNHLCRRSSTLGLVSRLPPPPFPEASFSERKANYVRTDGLIKSESELVE